MNRFFLASERRDSPSQRELLAVADALLSSQTGRCSRRDFLKSCLAAGIGVSSLLGQTGCRRPAPLLSPAQVEETLSAESAWISTSPAHDFLTTVGKGFDGKSLRIISEDTPSSRATGELLKAEFTPLTGIEVEWEQLPLEQVLSRIAVDVARQTGRYDLYYLDQAWLPRFSDVLLPPSHWQDQSELAYPNYDAHDFLAPLVRHLSTYRGQQLATPFDIPIYITIYRRDLFEKLGLRAPQNFQDYLSCAEAINSQLGPQVRGTSGQWRVGHYALTCDLTMWLWGHGGSVFLADGSPSIGDDQARAALEFMQKLQPLMSPNCTMWDWHDQSADFAAGLTGIYSSWGEFFPLYDDPSRSRIVGLADPLPCPQPIALRPPAACGFGETPGVSHQGGSSLSISRASKNPNATWILLQWITSRDIVTRACLLGGGSSPVRKSAFEDPRIRARASIGPGTTRHFDVTLDAILHHMGSEPKLPTWNELATGIISVEVGKLLTGQQNVSKTLENMRKRVENDSRTVMDKGG